MSRALTLGGIAALAVLLGCEAHSAAFGPGVGRAIPAQPFPVTDEMLARMRKPGDDPAAWVFEALGSARSKAERLEVGECILQYRRFNGQYTPHRYRLVLSREAVAAAGGRARSFVQPAMRGEILAARAVCKHPASEAAFEEAVSQIRARLLLPGAKRDSTGALKVYRPTPAELGIGSGAAGGEPSRRSPDPSDPR